MGLVTSIFSCDFGPVYQGVNGRRLKSGLEKKKILRISIDTK